MKFFSCLTILLHFFIFTSTIKVINAIPIKEFKEITSDEIKKNHLQLKKIVDNCYNKSIGYFDPQGEPRPDFDFKKAINLAAVGFQWVIVTEENNWITDFQVLESSQRKPLIVSNTSAYQWDSAISNEEDFHMISWPRTGRSFYSFELIKKKLKHPGTVGDLYHPYFRDIYRTTLATADNTINAYIHSLTQLTKKRFRDIKPNDLKFLKVLENVFDITLIYYNNRREPTEFFSKSGRRSIDYLLEEICKKDSSKKKLYFEEIVDPSIIEKDKEKYLLSSPSSLLSF